MFTWLLLIGVGGIGGILGGIIVHFWEKIKEWASIALKHILRAIDWAVKVASDAVVFLVKRGYTYYKRLEVWVRDIYSGDIVPIYEEQPISIDEIPQDVLDQLKNRAEAKLRVLQQSV